MLLHVITEDGSPRVFAALRVLALCDDGATPVALAVARPGGAIEVAQAALPDGSANPEFSRLLESSGVSRVVLLERAALKPLSSFDFSRTGGR